MIPASASTSRTPPPRGTGIPPSSIATPITCAMKPDEAASGPSPVCSTHGAKSPRDRSSSNVSAVQSRHVERTFPANSTRPRRPSRRSILEASRAPSRDHSSVPRTPKVRSALGMNSDTVRSHPGPSEATFSWCEVVRNRDCPSGKRVAVGSSVFRYSTPRASSSPRSCMYASDPVNSGCHEAKTSWTKPGSLISAVRIAPPSQSFRSSTQTVQPLRASSAPATSALIPLPTATAS